MDIRRSNFLKQVLGWLVGLACLAWVLHGLHGSQLLGQLRTINWGWIALAVLLDVLSYGAQGIRWSFLMRPLGRLSYVKSTQAIYVGLFTNEILPLRVGEVVRAFVASLWLKRPLFAVIPSMAVERFFDGVWLAIGIGVTALLVELPPRLLQAAEILGAVVILAGLGLFAIVLRKQADPQVDAPLSERRGIAAKISGILREMAAGIHAIGITGNFFAALFVSSLIVVSQILSFWFVMIGYGIHISLWAGAAVLLIEHLGTAIPNAPSNLGTYQFFTVVGLALFGVDKTTAAGFSMVVFVVLTLPLWAFGLLALMRSGLTLKEIRAGIKANGRDRS